MTDRQLITFYAVFLMFGLALTFGLAYLFDPKDQPTSAIDYANKYCQELYGPQTGAHWANDQMACITVRGEIVPAKQP
jgi:hypothetical protein